MSEISINITTFAAEGGSYRIELTKNDSHIWGSVAVAPVAWVTVNSYTNFSPFLYQIDVTVEENTSGSSRTVGVAVNTGDQSELFTIEQPAAAALAANVLSVSPAGNITAAGGQIMVDVEALNGIDTQSTASVSTGAAYCSLTSTQHGVTSGGVTATRFVFTVAQNTGTASRSATLTFTVRNGEATATATVTKAQNGAAVQEGSLSATAVSLNATDTAGSSIITPVDMTMTSVTATPAAAWITAAQVQISAGQYVCALTVQANTGSARSTTVVLAGEDIYGNTISTTFAVQQAAASATNTITAAWNNGGGFMDFNGGRQTAAITYTGTFTGNATATITGGPAGMAVTTNTSSVTVSWDGGPVAQAAAVPITISRTGSDSVTYSTVIYLNLVAGGVCPIWKDAYGSIASNESYEDYTLNDTQGQFYAGRAFAYPNESSISVNVSRVVAPYLTSYYKDVTMYSDGVPVAAFTFVRDYSYDAGMDYSQNQPLSFPVNGRVPAGVKLSVAEWGNGEGGSLQVTDEGGTLVVNEALVKGLNTAEFITGAEGKRYTFGAEVFTVVNACEGALLKYVNAYGGTDYLLVEGVCKKTDKITRASYEKDADALSQQFETKDYQATMEATWNGVTGWLTDTQSLRMRHLVESVEVYMLDLTTGEELPVVMRDAQLQYKTFTGNGRKLVNYSLTWTESQKKLRR